MDYKSDPSGGPVQKMLHDVCGGFAAAGQSFEPWLRASARGNLEVMTLMSRRAQAYMELPLRLSQCRSPQDVAAEQMRFWETMTRQYSESSQRVFGTWFELAQQSRQRADGNASARERDYITFPEPDDASAGSADERRAA
ncbi:MAG: hypothetical protein KJZ80_14005 [Hyphomicrobiaceae bacterium]|nr:hypothetical protein [Hyphomicrobiaceae bacterium]